MVPHSITFAGGALRRWTPEDAEALAHAWADPDIVAYNRVPDEVGIDAAARWIEGDQPRWDQRRSLDWVIETEASATEPRVVAGEVSLYNLRSDRRAGEVGFWLLAHHRGKGLATDALDALCAAAPGFGIDNLVARSDPDNAASIAVLRRCGFRLAGSTGEDIEVYLRRATPDDLRHRSM